MRGKRGVLDGWFSTAKNTPTFLNLFFGGLRGFRFWRLWDGGALVEGDLPSSVEEYPQ
jgi:hypothetical protein